VCCFLLQILLLDEATSALDAASEAIVTRALNELASGSKPKLSTPPPAPNTHSSSSKVPCRITLGNSAFTSPAAAAAATAAAAAGTAAGARSGRTTIIVAHRLATVTAADTIAVMSTGGKLLEMGSPAQLMSSGAKGHYAQMVMQQQHATPLAAAAAALQH
jgi:ABC-type multidrug transport system fused ATPase/permease subunit